MSRRPTWHPSYGDRVIVRTRRQWWRVPFTVAGFAFFGYGFAMIDTAPGTASLLALFGAMSWATALARDVR